MKLLPATSKKSCNNCAAQEGDHYCLLHSYQMKNMEGTRCKEWAMKKESRHERIQPTA
jgi:hypothetical protein